MFSLLGRGISYLVAGCLCLAHKWFNITVGCVIMVGGVFYIAMHFFGATPSPSMSAIPNTTTELNPGYGGAQYTEPNMTQSPNPNMVPNMVQSPRLNQHYD
ncbi:hypothetical protein BGZ76_002079 [Entomortierella beljakovae]|nr:hypothetical protein BGZ76_002079 [Entomortierella beljakovae]